MTTQICSTAVGVQLMTQLAQMLERQGLEIGAERLTHWMEATQKLAPFDLDTLRLTGHATLCRDTDSMALFDQCYAVWCAQQSLQNTVPAVRPALASLALPTSSEQPAAPAAEQRQELALAAAQDLLRQRDFSKLNEQEKGEIQRLLLALEAAPAMRRSRRFRRAASGRIDLRKTLRAALRSDGETLDWCYQQPRQRPRRRVLLIDVSGSMAPYADALLLLGFALMRSAPKFTEVFTVGTRLTRLTRAWRTPDPEHALALASQAVPDWMGGTLLGEQLQAFLDRWGKRGITRGAVVMIASDGWENGDGKLLGAQMARLHRMAHSVVWCNPHKSSAGYRPIARGISNALPYIDHFVSGCSVDELEQLVQTMQTSGGAARHAGVPPNNVRH
ncbi:VWA domain-containing protein [Comamonas sp. Z1]|uniref:vWA domain-containing protein n=1 Tax=Comamonas TaxID=283 RepID=UPI0009BC8A57|nr:MULTISPECIES: VWA domain-containing protein [Comamonas]TYK71024.1 VWA domain-containing protein [Comamonas sp. Z1]TYK73377.1 VWA domain-containing protein [Comamonas sp. Z3]